MKVHRSTKMALRFATASKLEAIQAVRTEYSRLVNAFIDKFWPWTRVPENNDLTAYHLHAVHTDASFSIAQDAAREARSMVATAKHQPLEEGDDSIVRDFDKPHHYGNRMILSHHVARIETSESATGFDAWLVLTTVQSLCGMKKLRIPIKLHRHYHKLAKLGKQATTVTITPTYVQVSFEIETGEKLNFKTAVGVDTGIKTLGYTSQDKRFGRYVQKRLERLDRCKHGSNGYRRAKTDLHQYIDLMAKKLVSSAAKRGIGTIVIENLKGITHKTKHGRRLCLKMRRWIGRWNVQYWLRRIKAACEMNRVRFATVAPRNTSRTCPSCGYVDPMNRNGEVFECLKCSFKAHADLVGAQNIVARFLTGPYGAGFKAAQLGN